MNNQNRPYNRQEAFEIYLALLDSFFNAAITEPKDIGTTLSKTAVTLATAFSEEVNHRKPEPTFPIFGDRGDVEMLGHFQVSGRSLKFVIDNMPDSYVLIADCKKALTAIEILKELEQILGIYEEN